MNEESFSPQESVVVSQYLKESRRIGENLRKMRVEAGLSRQDLVSVLKVTLQQIYKYENGKNRLPIDKLYLLKNFYGVPYECFFGGIEEIVSQPLAVTWPVSLHLVDVMDRDGKYKILQAASVLASGPLK